MEKDIDRITKNQDTDIVIRIDDFGGKRGVTIREFVKGERYNGFTKAGTRIPADKFKIFKAAINSINEAELMEPADDSIEQVPSAPATQQKIEQSSFEKKESKPKKAKIEMEDQEF